MGSLCLTMMYDIFEPHSKRDATDSHSDRMAIIVKQLMQLLSAGSSRHLNCPGFCQAISFR